MFLVRSECEQSFFHERVCDGEDVVGFDDAIFDCSFLGCEWDAVHGGVARDSGDDDVAEFFEEDDCGACFHLRGVGELDGCQDDVSEFMHVPSPRLWGCPRVLSFFAVGHGGGRSRMSVFAQGRSLSCWR